MTLLTILLAISGGILMTILIQLIIGALIFGFIIWGINWIGFGEPFVKPIKAIVFLIALVFLLNVLAITAGHGFITWY